MHFNRIQWYANWPESQAAFSPQAEVPITTVDDIIGVCPAFGTLLRRARAARRRRRVSCNTYEYYKRQLHQLVGWYTKNERLQTTDCYTIAHSALVDALDF
ncbi:hypothetical protein [Blastopirellula marina]|uniref:Uncharacterized protein n=1 Tax=Blastopirellula marina DSM 3645 TaxID=314230 RepID=A3ZUZ4_9BACT|nr:hypothetical protein [Blastopirellula marina]EAQ79730.1 hypothetical protein DSM3645_24515 [Blastopirellula marina DSM 3645]